MPEVDILILGAGWLSTFLIPLCKERSITHAATTRSGRDSTIGFNFDPNSDDVEPYKVLPDALTVLITFPIERAGASTRLVELYQSSGSNQARSRARFIQLGTISIWDGTRKNAAPTIHPIPHKWYDRHSPFIHNERANAESEILALSPGISTTVLNLAGLWGGSRSMRNWVSKVVPSKEVLQNKGSLHMIHGLDVSRAILAVHADFSKANGQRWILTDGRVYDWWDLASAWGSGSRPSTGTGGTSVQVLDDQGDSNEEGRGAQARWVRELMQEQDVRALPRNIESLGRALDSRDFWCQFGLSPVKARLD